jgi:hypothetical protein
MKKILTMLVTAVMLLAVFATWMPFSGITQAAESQTNNPVTNIANRWNRVGYDRYGCEYREGKLVPWEKKGIGWWGRTGYEMPYAVWAVDDLPNSQPIPPATARYSHNVRAANTIEAVGMENMLWTEVWLTIIPDNGKSTYLDHWYVICDKYGQVWFDPDGTFNDCRYYGYADPYDVLYMRDPNLLNTHDNCTDNPRALCDPIVSNNTQGPYIFDPDYNSFTNPATASWQYHSDNYKINNVAAPEYISRIYFWDAANPKEKRLWKLGWADMNDYLAAGARAPGGAISSGYVHDAGNNQTATGSMDLCQYKKFSDWDIGLSLSDFVINMDPTGSNNAVTGSVLHTENISYAAQFPDSVAAPIPPHANLTYDFGEFIYEKQGLGPIYPLVGPYSSNAVSFVDEDDVRRSPVVITRNTTMVMTYPGGSSVYDAGGDGVYQPGDDYDVGVSLWAFSDGTFPPGAAYPERYHDQVISGVSNNVYDTGEFIYREVSGLDYQVNGYTWVAGTMQAGDIRLTNVNGWQDNINDHYPQTDMLMYDTDGLRRAGMIDGDLLLMAEVISGGCISSKYDIAIESDAWIGWRDAGKWMPLDVAYTAAGIRSHFDTSIQHMNRIQNDTVLAEKANDFFVPATVFQNVKLYERQFVGWSIWLDDGIDNNAAVNYQYTNATKALDLSHNLEGFETMEQTVGATTLSKWDLDYGRGDPNDYIGAVVAFTDTSKVIGPPYGFIDTTNNGFGANETIYRDMDFVTGSPNGTVTVGDIRCSNVICYRNLQMVTYYAGSIVSPGDLDIGEILTLFTGNMCFYDVAHTGNGIPRNNQFDPGEDIYFNPIGQNFINYRSIRMSEINIQGNVYHSGSTVQMGRVLFVNNKVNMISVGNNGSNYYMDEEVLPGKIDLQVKIDQDLMVEQTSHIEIKAFPAPRDPKDKIYILIENLPRSSYNNIAEAIKVIDVNNPVLNIELTPYRGSCDLTGFVQDRKVYIHAFQEKSELEKYTGQLLVPKDGSYIDPFWLKIYRDPEKRAYANFARYVFDPVNDARYRLYEPFIGKLANSYDCYARIEKTVEPERLDITANRKCLTLLEQRFPNVVLNLYDWDNPNDVNDPANIPFATQSIPDRPHRVNYNARGAGIKFLFTAVNVDYTHKYIVQVNDDDTCIIWEWIDLEPLNMLSPLDTLRYRDYNNNGANDLAPVPYVPDPYYGQRFPSDAEPESEAERCSVIDQDCSGKQATCDICGEEQGFIPIGTVTLNDIFSNSYMSFNIMTYGVPTMVTDYGFLSTTDPGGQVLIAVQPRNAETKCWVRITAEQTIFNYNSIDGQVWPPNGPSFLNDYTGGVDYCGIIGFQVSSPDPDVNFQELTVVDHGLQYSRTNYTAGSDSDGYHTDPLHRLQRPAEQIQTPYNPIVYDITKDIRVYPGGQTHTGRLGGQRSRRKSGFNSYPAIHKSQFNKLGTEFFPLTDYGIFFHLKNIRGEHLSFTDVWSGTRPDLMLKKVTVEGPFIRPKMMNQNQNTYVSNNQYNGYQYIPIAYDISGKLVIDSTNSSVFVNDSRAFNGGNFEYTTSPYFTVADPIKSQIIYPTDTLNPQIPRNDYLRLLDRSLNYSANHYANIGALPAGSSNLFVIDEMIPVNYGNIKITVETRDGKTKIFQDCCNTPPTDGFNVWGLDIQNAPAEIVVDQDNVIDIKLAEYEAMQVNQECNDALVFCWQDRGIRTPGYQEAELNGAEPPRLGAGDGWITNPPRNSNYQEQMWQYITADDLNGDGKIKFSDFETEICGTYDMASNTWKTGVIDARTFQRNDGGYKFELKDENGCRINEVGFDFGGGSQIGGRFRIPDHVISEYEELPLWITAYKYGDDDNDRSFRPFYEIPPEADFGTPGFSHEVYLAATKPIKVVGQEDLVLKTTPEVLTAGVQSELVYDEPFTIEVFEKDGIKAFNFKEAGVRDMFGAYRIDDEKSIWNNMFKDPHPDDTYYYGNNAMLPRYYWLRTDLHNNDGTNKNNNYFFSSGYMPFDPIIFRMNEEEGKYMFERFVANDEGTFPVYIWSPDRKHRGKLEIKVRPPMVEYNITNVDDPDQKVFQVPATQGDTDFLMTAADNRLYKVKVVCKTQDGGQLIKGAAKGVSVCHGTDRDVARFTPAVDRPMTFAASDYGTFTVGARGDRVSAAMYPGGVPQFFTPRIHPKLGFDLDNDGKIEVGNNELRMLGYFKYMVRYFYIYSYGSYYYFYYYPPQEINYPVPRQTPAMYYRTENYGYIDPKTGLYWYPMFLFADIYANPDTQVGWGPGAIYNSSHKAGYCFADLTEDRALNFADALSLDNNGSTEFFVYAEDVCNLGGLVGDNIWSNNIVFGDVYGGINAYMSGFTLSSGYYSYGYTYNLRGEEWAPNYITRRYGMRLTTTNNPLAYIPASDDTFGLDWDAFPAKENYVQLHAPRVEALSATTREALRKDLLAPESFDIVYAKRNHVLMVFKPADSRDLPLNTGARVQMAGTAGGGAHENYMHGRTERSELDATATDVIMFMTPTGKGYQVLQFGYYQKNTRFEFPYEYRIYTDLENQPIFPSFDSVIGLEVIVESDSVLRAQVTGTLNITVREYGSRAPAGNAELVIEGAGVALPAKKCNDKGQATISITPTETGIINVKASLAGYLDGSGSIVVGVDVQPPSLVITDPTDMAIVNTPTTVLKGETTPGSQVTVNGAKAAVSADGKFQATVNLPNEGANTITIKATSPTGAVTISYMTIIRDTQPPSIIVDAPRGRIANATTYTLTGRVEPGSTVTVNGQPATVVFDIWTAQVSLVQGENSIKIEAKDAAQNTASLTHKITNYKADTVELVIGNQQYYHNNMPKSATPAPTMIAATAAIMASEDILATLGFQIVPSGNSYEITFGNNRLNVVVGSKNATINGQAATLEEAPVLSGIKLIIPIKTIMRLLVESGNLEMDWNDPARRLTITIYTP